LLTASAQKHARLIAETTHSGVPRIGVLVALSRLEMVMPEFPNMPYRVLGRTGARVSAVGLGGWRVGLNTISEALSIRIIRTGIDRGINFLDNSCDYNDGVSYRMPPLRAESARLCRHHRHRQHGDSRSGIRGGAYIQAND
jgi:hypothetical protein